MATMINTASFEAEVLQAGLPVMVDFWAPWCGPCKALNPIIEKVEAEIGGKAKIVKVNIDESPEIASKYSIMSIPTLLFFKDGTVMEQLVGLVQKDKIIEKINKLTD